MHDLIDRKAAIDILDAYQVMLENGEENPYSWARFRMSELPSAQQDCTECPEYDHDRHFCPKYCDVIRRTLEESQPERKTGKWNTYVHAYNDFTYSCNMCGYSAPYQLIRGKAIPKKWNFCPNCGARMMEGE